MIGGRWAGVADAADALEGIAAQVTRDDVVAEAMLQAAKPVVAAMQTRATGLGLYRTGAMVASLEAARVTDSASAEGIVVVELGPRKKAKHAHLVRYWELGHKDIPARPFMRPTWDEHESTWSTAVTAGLRKAYETVKANFGRQASNGWRARMQRAKTKGEFLAALKDMGEGAPEW